MAKKSGTSAAPILFDGIDAFPFDATEAVRHLRSADPKLATLIDAVGPFRMETVQDGGQLVSLARARAREVTRRL